MSNLFRKATLGAVLLAGTAAAHAQTVVVQDPAPPAYLAPTYVAPSYIAPAPVMTAPAAPAVIAEPAPIYTQAPIVAQPAPMAREIVTQPYTMVTQQPTERVQETVIRREASQPAIRRSARTSRVHLTRAQRREVLRTIRYERTPAPTVMRQVTTTPISYSVGSVLPATVPTYTMPGQVVYEAPALQGYAYAPVGDRVLLVEPASNTVVDELY